MSTSDAVPDWVADAIFYQIFPDRFARSRLAASELEFEDWDSPPTREGFKGGDLRGITEHLSDLTDLGVNAIYLNPIFSSASNHRYHAYDYFEVDPLLGGNTAFRDFLNRAQQRGLRVILDGVFNHCGRGFWPFHHLLECGEASPYRDWFTVKSWPLQAYEGEPNYEAWWQLPALPKFNVANPDTREYLLRVAEHWVREGADGWRLDVPQEIRDETFWDQFRARVKAIRPDAYLVGEVWDEAPDWVGHRFDGLMNYPLTRLAAGFCAEKIAADCTPGDRTIVPFDGPAALRELTRLLVAYPDGNTRSMLKLLSSHDTPRFVTQVSGDSSGFALATLLQMTLPGAPCVYYGDEIGLSGGGDPDCRAAFPWDRSRWDRNTYDFTRRAIALRTSEPALRRGAFEPGLASSKFFSYSMAGDDGRIEVFLNAGSTVRRVPVRGVDAIVAAAEELWAPELPAPRKAPADFGSGEWPWSLDLPARSARVLKFPVAPSA
ncbi:MAG: glycoside hydrolase family 13 protein [Planctomycetota bacterium]